MDSLTNKYSTITAVVPTYYANIYMGLVAGYSMTGTAMSPETVSTHIQTYIDKIENKFGVTVTPTTFVYPGGKEPGVIVGLVNYPRYPETAVSVLEKAIRLAIDLKEKFQQERLSIVTPEGTYLVGEK